ncbi:MAG: hypothetical protein KA436_11950 [Oligoflexales bacterium]|nr:hypothetical protein [Oligoflexales bacterium]
MKLRLFPILSVCCSTTLFFSISSLAYAEILVSCSKYSMLCEGETTGERSLQWIRNVNRERDGERTKSIYQETTTGRKWIIRKLWEGYWQEYFATKLYVAILGKEFVSDAVLFRGTTDLQNQNVSYIGSPFLHDFKEAATLCKPQQGAIRCAFELGAPNTFLVTALMMLLGESDASLYNLGFFLDQAGKLSLVKIDHDHSKFYTPKTLALDAFRLLHTPGLGSRRLLGTSPEELDGLRLAFQELSSVDWRRITELAWAEWVQYFPKCPREDVLSIVDASMKMASEYEQGLTVMRTIQSQNATLMRTMIDRGDINLAQSYHYIPSCQALDATLFSSECLVSPLQLAPKDIARILGTTIEPDDDINPCL